jgi:hypothetical protein
VARGEVTGRKTTVTDPDYEDGIAPLPRLAMTIPQFAAAHGFSTAMYFKQKKLGKGPREFKVGRRTFITFEAAARWRAEREAASNAGHGAARKQPVR